VSTNKIYAGHHWSKRKKDADSIVSLAGWFFRPIQRIESYPVEIRYKFFFVSRALDTTNCTYLVKCIEDALRAFEILKDDSPKFVERTIIESYQCAAKKISKEGSDQCKKNNEENEDRVEIIINQI